MFINNYINKIINDDCLNVLKNFPDNSIDLVVTSPPYDELRDYDGFNFNFFEIAKELYRIIKTGRNLVWIVSDQTKNYCETLSSFKQAIYFVDVVGFSLLDTMIYLKKNVPPTFPNLKRYIPAFEFMFVFCKGSPLVFNPLKDRKNKLVHRKNFSTQRQKDGSLKKIDGYVSKEFGLRFNFWEYDTGFMKSTKDKIAFEHPAIFPEDLVKDHILSWSNENDIVLDCMCGSGTTCKMANLLDRKFIGIEISEKYCKIAKKRIFKNKVTEI